MLGYLPPASVRDVTVQPTAAAACCAQRRHADHIVRQRFGTTSWHGRHMVLGDAKEGG